VFGGIGGTGTAPTPPLDFPQSVSGHSQRGKRLLVLVGQRKALGIAVRNDRPQRRYSGLLASLRSKGRLAVALA